MPRCCQSSYLGFLMCTPNMVERCLNCTWLICIHVSAGGDLISFSSVHPTCWLIVRDSAQLCNDRRGRYQGAHLEERAYPHTNTQEMEQGRFYKMLQSLPRLFSPWREQSVPGNYYGTRKVTQTPSCLLSPACLQGLTTGNSVGLPGSCCKLSEMKPGLCKCLKQPAEVRATCVLYTRRRTFIMSWY